MPVPTMLTLSAAKKMPPPAPGRGVVAGDDAGGAVGRDAAGDGDAVGGDEAHDTAAEPAGGAALRIAAACRRARRPSRCRAERGAGRAVGRVYETAAGGAVAAAAAAVVRAGAAVAGRARARRIGLDGAALVDGDGLGADGQARVGDELGVGHDLDGAGDDDGALQRRVGRDGQRREDAGRRRGVAAGRAALDDTAQVVPPRRRSRRCCRCSAWRPACSRRCTSRRCRRPCSSTTRATPSRPSCRFDGGAVAAIGAGRAVDGVDAHAGVQPNAHDAVCVQAPFTHCSISPMALQRLAPLVQVMHRLAVQLPPPGQSCASDQSRQPDDCTSHVCKRVAADAALVAGGALIGARGDAVAARADLAAARTGSDRTSRGSPTA